MNSCRSFSVGLNFAVAAVAAVDIGFFLSVVVRDEAAIVTPIAIPLRFVAGAALFGEATGRFFGGIVIVRTRDD